MDPVLHHLQPSPIDLVLNQQVQQMSANIPCDPGVPVLSPAPQIDMPAPSNSTVVQGPSQFWDAARSSQEGLTFANNQETVSVQDNSRWCCATSFDSHFVASETFGWHIVVDEVGRSAAFGVAAVAVKENARLLQWHPVGNGKVGEHRYGLYRTSTDLWKCYDYGERGAQHEALVTGEALPGLEKGDQVDLMMANGQLTISLNGMVVYVFEKCLEEEVCLLVTPGKSPAKLTLVKSPYIASLGQKHKVDDECAGAEKRQKLEGGYGVVQDGGYGGVQAYPHLDQQYIPAPALSEDTAPAVGLQPPIQSAGAGYMASHSEQNVVDVLAGVQANGTLFDAWR